MKDAPTIFGVPLEGGTAETVLAAATHTRPPFWIVTANPEILLNAQEDPDYAATLRAASWRTVDGFGLQLALHLQGNPLDRVTGVDLAEAILAHAAAGDWRVALFGSTSADLEAVLGKWRQALPELAIRGWSGGVVGPTGDEDARTKEDREAFEAWRPDVLLVSLGGGKKQERWIQAQHARWPWLRIVMGVGGAFDMWAGRLPRAPRFLQRVGLEWVWRFWLEPSRWRRMFRAVLLFPWRAWRARADRLSS